MEDREPELTAAGAVNVPVTVSVGCTFLQEQANDIFSSSSALAVFCGGAPVVVPLSMTDETRRSMAANLGARATSLLRTSGAVVVAGAVVTVRTTVCVVTIRVVELIMLVRRAVVVIVLTDFISNISSGVMKTYDVGVISTTVVAGGIASQILQKICMFLSSLSSKYSR